MKHKHHVIPKHAGGTDDPSNILELTVEEHAEAHRILFLQYGRWEDELAWKGLSGQISDQDLIRERQRLVHLNKPKSEIQKKRISENNGMRLKEISSKVSLKLKGNKNSSGHPNGSSNRGQIWITNDFISRRIFPTQNIPEGFRRGKKYYPRVNK